MARPLSAALVSEAAAYLAGRVRRTPLEDSPALSKLLGAPVRLKLESMQVTGSFKIRGAYFRLAQLSAAERAAGVVTCSAGNHGKAVAYVAREAGVRAAVYVPSSVDEAKHKAILELGAEVIKSTSASYDETEAWAMEEAAKAGRPFISAFDDEFIMAGNGGSLAVETVADAPAARTFVLPIGGGGLGAGFAYYVKENLEDSTVIGVQHEGCPALKLSLERGRCVRRMPGIETVAGGVEGGLGEKPFEILKSRVDRVALVSEAEILQATRWMLDAHQMLIEPSAAVVIAACLSGEVGNLSSPAVVVLSGRNVALSTIQRVLRGA
ncbi:MAG: pyridoxal-phosphate dependent enzyme [Elusimicrobia bacterium]|nr:pyridoxal-phosphate dependent enzyme [Elusimicrobiota bacterium]